MATKTRRFKRKLVQKPIRKKAEPVLSVNLIGKENVERIKSLVLKLISFTKGLKVTR